MPRMHEIGRSRREYNQWVANETLEDYALRFTPKRARRWPPFRVANTAIGGISFLALEAIGGAITLTYGFTNAAWAILVVGVILFVMGLPISVYAARFGVDIDLLSRGAGFGYLGSTITSVIYASFTFIFFALEAAIMAKALAMSLGVPEALGFVISSVVVIPLVTHGFTAISRFQMLTQPAWIVLHVLPFAVLASDDGGAFAAWTGFTGRLGPLDGSFDLLLFGAAASVVFSLVAQIGEQVDYLRFLPRPEASGRARLAWWIALVSSGPGWIVLGTLKLLAGSYLAYLAFRSGVPPEDAGEPMHMYSVAFTEVTGEVSSGLVLAAVFVVISQLKINVTNAYAGSIAWSNFFSRLTHSHPGRVVWVVFNVFIALLLMELGVYRSLEHILGLYAHVAVAWMGAIVADLVISKPLGLSPSGIEFKRAHLYDINPAGLGAMVGGSALSIAAYLGAFGETCAALSSFLALGSAMALSPLIAWRTKGRFFLAREPSPALRLATHCTCTVCVNRFETEDIADCPVYEGPICSLCCTLNARCADQCKTASRASDQLRASVGPFLPDKLRQALGSNLLRYLGLLCVVCAIVGGVMALVWWHSADGPGPERDVLAVAFVKTFLGLFLISCVVVWLFVLAHESRELAQQESERQTALLTAEIAAHEQTDKALQAAKEAAEAANLAKSRYLAGISHEFRTPLSAILGYAQLLERGDVAGHRAGAAIRTIRRSSEHLAGLVDGLLDVARIEAGRFQLEREEFAFPDFIEQIADMVRLQAESKGVAFLLDLPPALPRQVRADARRLRQILINLLSNAVKFTERGHVRFAIRLRNDVATFVVEDTGVGIAEEDFERIFMPFERIDHVGGSWAPGTGLGLTLTKLMAETMGGTIRLESRPGAGSTFTVQIHLPVVAGSRQPARPDGGPTGYEGPSRTILVVDDDESHRLLVQDLLGPMGFRVATAASGPEGLARAGDLRPDVILLDVTMPGMDGWEVARIARRDLGLDCAIVMMSAVGSEPAQLPEAAGHSGFVVKPFQLDRFLDTLGQAAGLRWSAGKPTGVPAVAGQDLAALREFARLGLRRRLLEEFETLSGRLPAPLALQLSGAIDALDYERVLAILDGVSNGADASF